MLDAFISFWCFASEARVRGSHAAQVVWSFRVVKDSLSNSGCRTASASLRLMFFEVNCQKEVRDGFAPLLIPTACQHQLLLFVGARKESL